MTVFFFFFCFSKFWFTIVGIREDRGQRMVQRKIQCQESYHLSTPKVVQEVNPSYHTTIRVHFLCIFMVTNERFFSVL